jgi:putative salt-induced outer membrane protein YdiY
MHMFFTTKKNHLAAWGALLVFASAGASADVVVMKNGDRITGTVKELGGAVVTIDPDYSDAIKLDLAAVDYVEAAGDFEGKLADGRDGKIELLGKAADGQQQVRIDNEVVAVPLAQVQEMTPPKPFYERTTHIDISLAQNRGNTDTDNNQLRGDTKLRLGKHRHYFDALFVRESTDGDSTKKQDLARYDYNWLFREPWFLSANASYERDPITDLDYRWIVGLNLGWDIWDSARRSWSIQAGPGVQFEDREGSKEEQAVLQYLMRFRHQFFDSKLGAFHNQSVTHNVTGQDNTVLKTSTGLDWKLNSVFYTRVSLDYDYETDPAAGAEKKDSALLFGLGADF